MADLREIVRGRKPPADEARKDADSAAETHARDEAFDRFLDQQLPKAQRLQALQAIIDLME